MGNLPPDDPQSPSAATQGVPEGHRKGPAKLPQRHTARSCVHRYELSFNGGRCSGCLKFPISGPSYPDHYSRQMYVELDREG